MQQTKTGVTDLVADPGGAALRRVAVDVRLDEAVLERVGRPVFLQELLLELGGLHAPGKLLIRSVLFNKGGASHLDLPTKAPKRWSSLERSVQVRIRSSLVPGIPPVRVCARCSATRLAKTVGAYLVNIDTLDALVVLVMLYDEGDGAHLDGLAFQPADSLEGEDSIGVAAQALVLVKMSTE